MARRYGVWAGLATALLGAALLAACSPAKNTETASSTPAADLTPLRFATDWHAQAEHGGFYEALAEGEYRRRGLDVTIVQGGPAVNVPQLLASGAVDMGMGSNSFIVMNLAAEKAPVKAVAAFMQKDPQVLMAHPDDKVAGFADMKGRPILIADAAVTSWWPWLKTKFGFTDAQVRKYTNSNATFLADRRAIQEGYITAEPYILKKEGHIEPKVFLLADAGYPGYSTMALATDKLISSNPAAVKAFIEASATGWHDYLYGDPKPADALILKENPDMTQDVLDQARDKMRQAGLIDGGDAKTAGVGTMSDKRWAEAFKVGTDAGLYTKTMNYKAGYTLQFVASHALMAAALDQVEVAYGARKALGPFSLRLESGEIVALVGPSGCGKSTAMRLLAGLEQPTHGRVERLAGRGETSVVFQAPTLMPWASALDNVALPLRLAGVAKAESGEKARAALAQVRLAGSEEAKPAQLSGGMAMRASLARALVTQPRLLLLDEPFAALDEITRRDLALDIHRLWAERKPAIMFVTHNVEEAVFMASRVIVMTPGPGRLKSETPIDAPLPRPDGFRTSALFRGLVEQVSASLAEAMAA